MGEYGSAVYGGKMIVFGGINLPVGITILTKQRSIYNFVHVAWDQILFFWSLTVRLNIS